MSIDSFFAKDIEREQRVDRELRNRKKEQPVLRPRPQKKLTLEDRLDTLFLRLQMVESQLKEVRKELAEIKDLMFVFGLKYEKNEIAKVALRYRKKGRERWKRYKERQGDEE